MARERRKVMGTHEAKRRIKATPDLSQPLQPRGCLIAAYVYLGICLSWHIMTRSWRPIVLAVPVAALLAVALLHYIYGRRLLLRVRSEWTACGIRCLVVHSNSPVWSEHIASHWMPRLGAFAVTLNWSERANWPESLEVDVFRHFCLREYNFNPVVIVFRGLKEPFVFRFYYAFHEAKNGRSRYLDELERQLFHVLDA